MKKIRKDVILKCSKQRRNHIFSVCDLALLLAKQYKVNEKQVERAALLHDIAKELEITKKDLKKTTYPSKEANEIKDLRHSLYGSYLAKVKYGTTDKKTLDAIAYHTTGSILMGDVAKIVYVADYFDPYKKYKHKINPLDEYELNFLVSYVSSMKIKFLRRSGKKENIETKKLIYLKNS